MEGVQRPDRDAKLDRIEYVLERHADRCFAFDEFGPLAIHPVAGCCWAPKKRPQRLRANFHKTCGVRQFHAVYSVGDDTLWGVVRSRKCIVNSLAAIKSCRAARSDGEAIFVILDNLSAHKAKKITKRGAPRTTSSCASRRPTRRGRTRSSVTSDRCATSCSTTATTRATST